MAGQMSKFLNGTEIVVKLGDLDVLFLQSIQLNDPVTNQMVFAMGEYGPTHNEPIAISGVSGSFRVQRYSDAVLGLDKKTALDGGKYDTATLNQANTVGNAKLPAGQDGNSMALLSAFSPAHLLLETTVDIVIYARTGTGPNDKKAIWKIADVVMTGYSLGFQVQSLAAEDYSFIARAVVDLDIETGKV